MENSINTPHNFELKRLFGYERQDIQKENQDIYSKVKKQLSSYKRENKNYMQQKANFLKNVGFLVRYSHEIAIFMILEMINIFKEKIGFHSINDETNRLYFSYWIKKTFNEMSYLKIVKNKIILSQISDLLDIDKNNFFKELFPDLIKLYFQCFMTDVKVEIRYAKEEEQFDWDSMIDDLISDSEVEKKILFTFLPGLYCNGQFFQNSLIHVVTYKIDNPNKFQFQKPIFINIGPTFNLDLNQKISITEIYYEKKQKYDDKRFLVQFQIVMEPDIKWDNPKYELILLNCNNYKITNNPFPLEESNYKECACNIIVNNTI